MLNISYPVVNGRIRKWDEMNHIWDYTWEKLGADPTEHKILMTEPPLNPVANKEKVIETMLERYQFAGASMKIQALLVLYAQGLENGVVVDIGDGVSHVIPVWDGICPPHLIKRLDVAGRSVTSYLVKLLQARGYNFNRSADFESVRQIKEQCCYVAYDTELEKKLALETTTVVQNYKLPDGQEVKLGMERFEAPEVLFRPSLVDIEAPGIHELLFNMIQKDADIHLRLDFYKQIVLSGGSTMFPGLSSRLEKEVRQLYLTHVLKGDEARLKKFQLKIEDPPRRKNLVFHGGSIYAEVFQGDNDHWISQAEWKEFGRSIIQRKGI